MQSDLLFASVAEDELDEALAGIMPATALPWPSELNRLKNNKIGEFGIICQNLGGTDKIKPLVVVIDKEQHRRFFSRYSQLRSDLSPITSWCTLLSGDDFQSFNNPTRQATLHGYAAAWSGLAVAESLLLSKRPIGQIRIPACLSTSTFAIGRTTALWERIPLEEVLKRYNSLHKLIRNSDSSATRLRESFQPVWNALRTASSSNSYSVPNEIRCVVRAIRELQRYQNDSIRDDSLSIYNALIDEIPEAGFLKNIRSMTPEDRLNEFDKIVSAIGSSEREKSRKIALSFLAGYIANIAAGGVPSLALAENVGNQWPEVTAWAYAIGGLGEPITWTSSFDGLGRLVARELERPFRIDDAPTSDFSLDEASVLIDRQLADPLVHLRVKQLRVATIGFFPGVNVAVPLVDSATLETRQVYEASSLGRLTSKNAQSDFLDLIVDAVIPKLQERLSQIQPRSNISQPPKQRKSRTKSKKASVQNKELPLD